MRLRTDQLRAEQRVTVSDTRAVMLKTSELLSWVFQAVAEASWNSDKHRTRCSPSEWALPEPAFRTLLVYCYLTGIYGSEEIENAAAHHAVVQYLCGIRRPRWEAIRDFRRKNADGLKQALTSVLSRAAKEHAQENRASAIPTMEIELEAERILARAMQADSIALDV